ncbi:unnamed protein product, partial [Amoebophrya sp. A25]
AEDSTGPKEELFGAILDTASAAHSPLRRPKTRSTRRFRDAILEKRFRALPYVKIDNQQETGACKKTEQTKAPSSNENRSAPDEEGGKSSKCVGSTNKV